MKCFDVISLILQYGISKRRNGLLSLKKSGGIIYDSSIAEGFVKSLMMLEMKRFGYPALSYFCLMA